MSKQWKEEKAVHATSLRKCSLLLWALTTTESDTSKLWSIACCGTVLTSNIKLRSQGGQLRSTRGQVEANWRRQCYSWEKITFGGRIICLSVSRKETQPKGVLQQLTYDAKRLPGKAESSLPSSVATAASCRPDTDDVLQPKHHDHHKLLFKKAETMVVLAVD